MKFETILALITEPMFRKILEDQSRTLHQRAADIAAIFEREENGATAPAPRKGRTIKPKPDNEPTSTDEGIG